MSNNGKITEYRMSPIHFISLLVISLSYIIYQAAIPSLKDVLFGFLCHFVLTTIPMSVGLHRFFSHAAFEANRVVTFLLAVMSCLAYQYGPIWWSCKHRRHHKFCDRPEDPHSWKNKGLLYAWILWTLHDSEYPIQEEYVHARFKNSKGKIFPELLFMDKYWYLPSQLIALVAVTVYQVPLATMLWRFYVPTMLCPIATLWFNCQFHPPTAEALKGTMCGAIDLLSDPLAYLHGEGYHRDHHVHPRKAQRPGPDLAWYLFISPLMTLGVFSPLTLKQNLAADDEGDQLVYDKK